MQPRSVMLPQATAKLPKLVRSIAPDYVLGAEEIRTIVRVAFLAAEIDLDEDPSEQSLLAIVNRSLWRIGGYPPEPISIVSPLPLPIDHEARRARIHELAGQLGSTQARELAYSIAYLLTVQDLQLAPVESTLLEELRRALDIHEDRAAELVVTASELMTPGVAAPRA